MKNNLNKNFRIYLNAKAHKNLKKMTNNIKKEYPEVKISQALLNSWLINWFCENQFTRQKKQISDDHFDPVRQLQSLLKDCKKDSPSKNIDHKELIKKLNVINSKIKKSTITKTSALPVVETTTDQ